VIELKGVRVGGGLDEFSICDPVSFTRYYHSGAKLGRRRLVIRFNGSRYQKIPSVNFFTLVIHPLLRAQSSASSTSSRGVSTMRLGPRGYFYNCTISPFPVTVRASVRACVRACTAVQEYNCVSSRDHVGSGNCVLQFRTRVQTFLHGHVSSPRLPAVLLSSARAIRTPSLMISDDASSIDSWNCFARDPKKVTSESKAW